MPQMAPLWWEFLFIMTLMMFMIMCTIIYFNKKNSINVKIKKINKKSKMLKW
uniref:ATP synthase F0 subunit 8 n=1 Tax=Physopelta slanbuschii TaxID=1768093 RepID=A0A4Y1JVR2_9HEMI|nr:ATP synthase F0 subunit 8 [Physopelta slanbuschii]APO08822.1 ATP synthase F0 subunit 8 [Physopelta slanbuschii]